MKINKIIAFASAVQLMAAGGAISSSALSANAATTPEISAASMKSESANTTNFKIEKSVSGDQVVLTVSVAKAASLKIAGYSFSVADADGLTFVKAENGSKFEGKTEYGKNTNEVAFRSDNSEEIALADGDVVVKLYFSGNKNADPGVTMMEVVDSFGVNLTDKITLSGNAPFMLGDVTLDGKIDAADATDILKAYSNLSTGGASGLNATQRKAAEVIVDDKIDAADATEVLKFYSFLSTGGSGTFEEFLKK